MNMLKSLAHGIAVTLLPLMLFTFGTLVSAYQVLGSPDPLKHALSESGLYEQVVGQVLQNTQKDAAAAAQGIAQDIPVTDPSVKAAISQAIPPEVIREQAEKAIDNTYGWAQGKQDNLSFSLDLGSDTKTKIADGLASLASDRLASLPACPDGQTGGIENPLTATCVPAGMDTAATIEKVRSDIVNNPEFLKDAQVDASTLKTEDGKTLADKLNVLPNVYEQVRLGLYISGALVMVCIAVVILCAGTIRTGLKRVAIISIVVGIVSALLALASGVILQQLVENPKFEIGENSALQKSIVEAIEIFTGTIRNWWVGYGVILAGVGVITLVALRFTRPPKDLMREFPSQPQDKVVARQPIAEKLANERPAAAAGPTKTPTTAPRLSTPAQRGQQQQSRPGYRPGKKIQ